MDKEKVSAYITKLALQESSLDKMQKLYKKVDLQKSIAQRDMDRFVQDVPEGQTLGSMSNLAKRLAKFEQRSDNLENLINIKKMIRG